MAHQLTITKPVFKEASTILTEDALIFIQTLTQKFSGRVNALLSEREKRQTWLSNGHLPNFLEETSSIREGDWKIRGIPNDLLDRRVEITGPVERKMMINALNSGAKVYMADFEDSHCPTWEKTIQGQINLRDAVRNTISFTKEDGTSYALNHQDLATLIVRPRGWHLQEHHLLFEGKPIPGALMDVGLYFFHNYEALRNKHTGPYFYLPKLENHKEAQLWDDIFVFMQHYFSVPVGTIKATVLIEVITAVFEMHEILYTLRDHIVGLNCGRWDYIFSYIKKLHHDPERVLPDRMQVTMDVPFLDAYSKLLIQTCHRRGAFAMGGMAPFIPIKDDEASNAQAFKKVRADKEREVKLGHDGTWVAHPGLIPIAMEVFNQHMPQANQLKRPLDIHLVNQTMLLEVPKGTITEAGFRNNISVCLQYLASWLGGNGCVPIFNLMEDAATAEIARSQLWQWVRYPKGKFDDGRNISKELFTSMLREEMLKIKEMSSYQAASAPLYEHAVEILSKTVLSEAFTEFITLPALEVLKQH